MSDLSSLMNIAPGTSAFFMGQNQAQQRALKDLEQMKMAAEASQAADKHRLEMQLAPLKQQNQSLINQGLERGLEGITADSSLKGTNARKAAATATSDIETILSNNESTKGKNSEEARTRTTNFLLQAGPQLHNTPGPLRAGAFKAMIEQAGMNANNPQIKQMLLMAQQNPEAFPQAISAMADRLGQQAVSMNPNARVSRENNTASIASSEKQGDANRSTQKEIAEIQARSREAIASAKKTGADLTTAILSGKVSPEKAAVAAKLQADLAKTEEERQFWQQKAMEYEQFTYNKPQAGGVGKPTIDPEGGLGQRTITPALGPKPKRGTGTKDDPIKLD